MNKSFERQFHKADPANIEPCCSYVYAKGKMCTRIVRIQAFKADLPWHWTDDGKWSLSVGDPRPHYYLYCSEKGNHEGCGRPDSEAMKFYYQNLPPALRKALTEASLVQ